MPSKWAVEKIQEIRMACGNGAAGKCQNCLKDLERVILQLDERKNQLKYIAENILQENKDG